MANYTANTWTTGDTITKTKMDRLEAGAAAALPSADAPELIRDTIGTALAAGSNVTITPNDAGDTITIAASGSGGSVAVVSVADYATDGASDSTSGIAAAFTAANAIIVGNVPDAYDGAIDYARKARVVFGRGLWNTTATITIPQGVDVEIEADAIVRASSAGTMGPLFSTTLDTVHQAGRINCRGTIDCNNKASNGIYIRSFAAYELVSPRVLRPTSHGIILGDPSSTSTPYEGIIHNPVVVRPNGTAPPAGSIGIWVQSATDCYIGGPNSVVVGFDIGVKNGVAGGNNSFSQIHVWGFPPNAANGDSLAYLPTTGFVDDTIGSIYTACYVDTPDTYGFQFTADNPGALLSGCRVYLNSAVTDDTVQAVRLDSATLSSVSVVGLLVRGEDNHRAATDYGGNLTGSVRVGTVNQNVTAPVGDYSGDPRELYPDLHDRFVGTAGAAPAAARWTVTTGGAAAAAAVINANRLRLTTGATGGYAAADAVNAAAVLGGTVADVDVLAQIEFGSTNESYLKVAVRATVANVAVGSGYAIQVSQSGGFVGLNKYVAGVQTGLYFQDSMGFTTGTRHWVRLRVQGSRVSMWHWAFGQPQPYAPAFDDTDTSVSAAGLVAVSHSGGSAAASGVAYLRQATVTVL